MADGSRKLRIITNDDALLAAVRAGLEGIDDWEIVPISSQEAVFENLPEPGDLLLVDVWSRGINPYEFCRGLTGRAGCPVYLVVEQGNVLAEPIAHFCGATGVLSRPLTPTDLRAVIESSAPAAALPSDRRDPERGEFELPEALLTDIHTGEADAGLVEALIDPSSGLFNYAFLNYKLDEEFKRAKRFNQPLSCVMLGYEGQADDPVVRELASIFLLSSRDTDLLGRFDENAFLFLLPNTGPDGARIMAHRVAAMAQEQGLVDLVGDPLVLAVGISCYPHPDLKQREQLYGAAREAFFSARADGGGVVCVG